MLPNGLVNHDYHWKINIASVLFSVKHCSSYFGSQPLEGRSSALSCLCSFSKTGSWVSVNCFHFIFKLTYHHYLNEAWPLKQLINLKWPYSVLCCIASTYIISLVPLTSINVIDRHYANTNNSPTGPGLVSMSPLSNSRRANTTPTILFPRPEERFRM